MTDIAKFQSTDLTSLAKAWGTDVANLSKIMGMTAATSLTGNVAAGTPVVFESAITLHIAVCMMDSTYAIVCYRDGGNSNYGTAVCLSLSGSTITAGTPIVFESAATAYISVCMMDSTHAIVAYQDGGNTSYGTAVCLSLSGTTISAGTPVVFESANTQNTSTCRMDSTHAIVSYTDGGNSNYGTACCLTLSGTTITAGTPVVFESANNVDLSVCSMDSTHAIVAYSDAGNNYYGTACCLSLSGTTITAGTPVVFENADAEKMAVCSVDSTHAIVVYTDYGNSSRGTACCLSLSDTTVSAGTPAVFESNTTSGTRLSVCTVDATHAVAVFQPGGTNYGAACCLTLSGTTITGGTRATFEPDSVSYLSVCAMDGTHAIVCYQDTVNSSYGTACCLTIS